MQTTKELARRPRARLSFRAFYISILLISVFAVFSLITEQTLRFHHGLQYGIAQRRAVAELDPMRLLKRDEEVSLRALVVTIETICSIKTDMATLVSSRPSLQR
jgi:hypothetical protein